MARGGSTGTLRVHCNEFHYSVDILDLPEVLCCTVKPFIRKMTTAVKTTPYQQSCSVYQRARDYVSKRLAFGEALCNNRHRLVIIPTAQLITES